MPSLAMLIAIATQSLLWQTTPLQIGAPAPSLSLGEFVAGEPVHSGHVLRFWTSQTQSQIYYIEGNTKDAIKIIEDTMAELEKSEKDLPTEERRVMSSETRSDASFLLKKYTAGPDPP